MSPTSKSGKRTRIRSRSLGAVSTGTDTISNPATKFESPSKDSPITKARLLELASAAVIDRGLNYGTPEGNFRRIANRWNAHLRNVWGDLGQPEIEPEDVAIMMTDVKLARLGNNSNHLDSWIDVAGYAACGANISSFEK